MIEDRGPASPPDDRASLPATAVWGVDVAPEDFVAVPRALIRLGRHLPRHPPDLRKRGRSLSARHVLLLLVLASYRYRDRAVFPSWRTLALDLGVTRDSARRWAYELERLGFLTIRRRKGWNPSNAAPDDRSNEFDLAPFVEQVLRPALADRAAQRERSARQRTR